MPCPSANLVGVTLRAGDDVDGIGPICARVNLTRDAYDRIEAHTANVTRGAYRGGAGGQPRELLCPPDTPLVLGIAVEREGADNVVVNSVALFCGRLTGDRSVPPYPSAVFEGPRYTPSSGWLAVGGKLSFPTTDAQQCPVGEVAVGLHGRNTDRWLNAVGLICAPLRTNGEPPHRAPQVRSIGRIDAGGSSASPSTPSSICAAAFAARERNSPAAADLAARCGRSTPGVRTIGRAMTTAATDAGQVCAAARDARDRRSPAAAELEARCKAAGGTLD